ncbi:MAG TPA: PEP/pyruvate-binding domain-containing protein [Candidatus Polarisedimenticolaceae bacterium]|nr:PEP/pyruvate-binding domain-containing protein [Candidatus Polarisedimenticolaceae bacterium]
MKLAGRAIAPGVARGRIVRNRPDLTPREAEGAILVAERAVPDDVPRIVAAAGTITGMAPPLSHVGLLSRELGKPSVGLPRLDLLVEGAFVVVDGTRGVVVIGDGAEGTASETRTPEFRKLSPLPSSPPGPIDPRFVVPLAPGLARQDVGGKAAGLSAVMNQCRVPSGFVVTAAAYRRHIEGEVDEKLRRASDSRHARAAILASPVPGDVRNSIEAASRELSASRLAVRSSATIEDGPQGTLAGLFDSRLGVSPASLVSSVRATWASLWNERAIAYLGGFPSAACQAVLVQAVVPTSPSGVFETDGDTVTVNAAWGLGEAIAQGEVAGDLFRLRASTGEILSSEIVPAATWIVLDPNHPGTIEEPLPDELRGRPSLTTDQLETLAAAARTLGPGRIVEWGFDDSGNLVVFQVRRTVSRPGG